MEYGYSKLSLAYHDIFNFPLNKLELVKWYSKLKNSKTQKLQIIQKNNFYFINGRQNIIKNRIENEKYSQKKLKIAKKAAILILKIPTILFVGITGSLAMLNADKNSDIDLMIITKANTLWITRLYCYIIIWLNGYKTRHPKSKLEKDKLCINLWLDESDLIWDKKDRNIYTAHEIAQIIPLVNKDKTYEKFLFKNKWILSYWPNAMKIQNHELRITNNTKNLLYIIHNTLFKVIEYLVFKIQYQYMKPKITREIITSKRAIFHPNDWGKVVIEKLSS